MTTVHLAVLDLLRGNIRRSSPGSACCVPPACALGGGRLDGRFHHGGLDAWRPPRRAAAMSAVDRGLHDVLTQSAAARGCRCRPAGRWRAHERGRARCPARGAAPRRRGRPRPSRRQTPNVVLASAVPKSTFARRVCRGTRPSRYHSRRPISEPPRRPATATRTPRAPERMAVCTQRRIARRKATRPASCSATPWASSAASVSGRDSLAAWFMSSTFTSTRFFV